MSGRIARLQQARQLLSALGTRRLGALSPNHRGRNPNECARLVKNGMEDCEMWCIFPLTGDGIVLGWTKRDFQKPTV